MAYDSDSSLLPARRIEIVKHTGLRHAFNFTFDVLMVAGDIWWEGATLFVSLWSDAAYVDLLYLGNNNPAVYFVRG
jgi:hypothetical protein